RLKCELVAALRAAVDDELMNVTSARAVDLARLITAVETLTRFLADAKPKENEPNAIYKKDPYKVMDDIIDRWIAADRQDRAEKGLPPRVYDEAEMQKRIEELEAENLRLRGQGGQDPKALPAPEAKADRVITPSESEAIPPGEIPELNMKARPGRDDHRVKRQPQTIDGTKLPPGARLVNGRIEPIPPQAKTGAETEAQRLRVNADRATMHRVMTQPSRVKGEPTPSSILTTFGDPVIWPVR